VQHAAETLTHWPVFPETEHDATDPHVFDPTTEWAEWTMASAMKSTDERILPGGRKEW
jgi:hypothetical protein